MRPVGSTPNRELIKVVFRFLLALQISVAGTVSAAEFCSTMQRLVEQAESNFLETPTQVNSVVEPRSIDGAEKCSMARALSGSNTFHCAWEFPYRANAANDAFHQLVAELSACFDGLIELAKDLEVNHPDYYDLHQYQLNQTVLTVSLKDKSELRRTYVFVGIQGNHKRN